MEIFEIGKKHMRTYRAHLSLIEIGTLMGCYPTFEGTQAYVGGKI